MKEKRNVIILSFIAIIITLTIGIAVRNSTDGILFDMVIMDYIHSRTTSTGVSMMKFVSLFGSVYFFLPIGIIIVGILRNKSRRGIKLLILSILGSYIFNATFKIIFARIRPLKYFLVEQGGYSFPSGHSMVSMSFYTTVTYLLLEGIRDKKVRSIMWVLNFIIIGMIGFSRLYLGVHWPTDIIVGYLIGYVFFYISKTTVKE